MDTKIYLQNKAPGTCITAILAALTTILIYVPSLGNKFVTWDDNQYIYNNLHIRSLDAGFFKWAFFDFHASNWHPLTWISHAVDYRLWELDPFGHHLTSVLLHGLNTFLVVRLISILLESAGQLKKNIINSKTILSDKGKLLASGLTGLLFGIHPLHVESVAWVSERKDVLYSFFYLIGIMTYVQYAKKPSDERPFSSVFSNRSYLSTMLLFSFSLMSKPMAVTLPVVLLILDYYPLGRFEMPGRWKFVFAEKFPFFMLSFLSSALSLKAQDKAAATFDTVPFSSRILVGFKSLILYIYKMVLPLNLSPFYPYPQTGYAASLLSFEYFFPLFIIIAVTVICISISRKQGLWLASWGYYLSTIFPVLGFIQVGGQAMADRYTYLSSLGPFVLCGLGITWLLDGARKTGWIKISALTLFFFLSASTMSLLTLKQIQIWKNGETLWNRVIGIFPDVPKAYINRGSYYIETFQYEKAIDDFTLGMRLTEVTSDHFLLYTNRGFAYAKLGKLENAIKDTSEAIRLYPGNWNTYSSRGQVYFLFGKYEDALKDYTEAIRLNPRPDYYNNRGIINRKLGRTEESIRDFENAERIKNSKGP
jgi:protein O-mannosyl-transferase